MKNLGDVRGERSMVLPVRDRQHAEMTIAVLCKKLINVCPDRIVVWGTVKPLLVTTSIQIKDLFTMPPRVVTCTVHFGPY
jgi:hypothetical protein